MIIILTLLLIIVDIGLRVAIIGLDLAFFVGNRLDDLRKTGENALLVTAQVGKSKKAKAAMATVHGTRRVAEGAVKIVANGAKSGLKLLLQGLKWCVDALITALLGVEAVVVVIVFLVILILIAVCGYWLYYMS